jgi:RNA polymerase sigma-70 factor (ECF subfamily)
MHPGKVAKDSPAGRQEQGRQNLQRRRLGSMEAGAAADRVWRERGLREAVLAGDEQAWRLWYDESCADLFAYILWRCGGLRDRAEEVVQETWLTAVRRLSSFDPTAGSFAGWLRGIAGNLLRNHFRQDFRRQGRHPPVDRTGAAADAETLRREQAETVARALASLPEHYEAVLRAKYLEGRSMADIALMRGGDSIKAVESLLTRAREAFRAAYQPDQ